jgi:hypothetical protein
VSRLLTFDTIRGGVPKGLLNMGFDTKPLEGRVKRG